MKCKGKLLTEEQIDKLSFLVHKYYNEGIDICSCNFEQVLALNTKDTQPVRTPNEPLLVIEVLDMNSVPSVTYKGEDIKGRVSIDYEWKTNGFEQLGSHNLKIKHIDCHEQYIVQKTIQEERVQ